MTDDAARAYGATIAKRRLSARLAALRQDAGLKPAQVEDLLGWKRGRLGRIEHGDRAAPNPSFVRDLLRAYEAPAGTEAEIMDLVKRADVRPWWRQYSQAADPDRLYHCEFPGFENDACRISVHAGLLIPELLQTLPYAEALAATRAGSARWRERAGQARLRRQQVLCRTDGTAPRLIAVVTEASLLCQWGTRDERRAQVRHLAEASGLPNVELWLLRLQDGLQPGMSSEITIFDFPGDPSIVFLGSGSAARELTKTADARSCTAGFARLRQAALAPSLAAARLGQLAETVS